MREGEDATTVTLSDVDCSSLDSTSPTPKSRRRATVAFHFTTPQSANQFCKSVKQMQQSLFIASLQHPQADETEVLSLQAAQVYCDDFYIPNAKITITRNSGQKYRLIVVSHNRSTIISQILAEDFFTSANNRPNLASPTFVVQMKRGGSQQIRHYERGIRNLSFRTEQATRMFKLARDTISLRLPSPNC